MKVLFKSICLFLLVSIASAQQEYIRKTPSIASADPKWDKFYESDRFCIYYHETDAFISQADANTGLAELEKIWDFYITQSGFSKPYENATTKYKINLYILRPGDGWAFGGVCIEGHPAMWLAAGAVKDKWALAHEFMHSLQNVSGGFRNSPYTGWFWESHANFMAHQMYPAEAHCTELYTRMANLYYGSTRNRYCNWQFFEYLKERLGLQFVNDLWTKSDRTSESAHRTECVLSAVMRTGNYSVQQFGDLFGDFATKNVIWDYQVGDVFRQSYNSMAEKYVRQRYTYLEALDGADAEDNRYVVPFAFAPQRYAYNIIRIYPDQTGTVTVKFRGDIQKSNNIPNYRSNHSLEPQQIPDPGSDWRYALVAVNGTSARYSTLARASDGNPDVSMTLASQEKELYLVVTATPTIHHKILWDQFYYTIYRYPYMVEIDGGKPEGFQQMTLPSGGRHPNGGGFVASTATVASTAYVGPDAKVLGNAQVKDNARIEGRAVVKGNSQVYGNAVVKDYALVAGGRVYGSAVVSEGANIWAGEVFENARVDGAANVDNNSTRISGNARVGGVVWMFGAVNLSGTAQLLGDGEVYQITATKGVFYGIVDAATVSNASMGANRSEPALEVTAPRSMTWPDLIAKAQPVDQKIQSRFIVDRKGLLHFSLGSSLGKSFKLKVFDSRGRFLYQSLITGNEGVIPLHSTASSSLLIWKIEGNGVIKKGTATRLR